MNQPNVILVITDDQGYGDLGCTGNPWIQTPNIDRFYGESLRLRDFHVSPLCTPTRGAIMTGHHPVRNGAWATCWGRSILRRDEVTMADVFAASGYRTGMFGKWHLGDNYPYRPMDRGFQHVVAHKGGGVGQTPDFWGNNYFDDTYFHNGEPVPHEGYCTDVWFTEATKFIEANRDRPFFAYIATNAPHGPFLVAEKYSRMYEGNPDIPNAAFCGMVTNIDENFGRLEARLKELGIADNTILIFMTDNGSDGGLVIGEGERIVKGYNAGMRGKKGSYYDGGHRVPFFVRWPDGGIGGGKDIDEMAFHVDLLPTFIDLCGLKAPNGVKFDGISLAGLVHGREAALPDRTQFLQYRQDTVPPEKWTNAVVTKQWRLVRGVELYDIKADPGQQHDVAARYPEVVARLREAHERWWEEISPRLDEYSPISLGNDAENPTRLDAMDVMGDMAFSQNYIVLAKKSTGKWTVDVERPGAYRFSLRRWPKELGLPIGAVVSPKEARSLTFADGSGRCATIRPARARLRLFDREWVLPVDPDAPEVTFTLHLTRTGVTVLEAWFMDADGDERGAYYVYVERV
ncbi:MAG TPA: arylsulfatase [Candidatus Latescibacteria bacterium]|nr:arylsulfatase [Candidatus Latescibacterota bacterium]HPK74576.1 arylsulfatase [Candidatus Latescibacterota bacterium]